MRLNSIMNDCLYVRPQDEISINVTEWMIEDTNIVVKSNYSHHSNK